MFSLLLMTLSLSSSHAEAADLKVGVGLNVGALIPVADLGPGPLPRADLSLRLPVLDGRLAPVLSVGWSQLAATGAGEDERVGDGAYTWQLQQRMLPIGLGLTARFLDPQKWVQPELTLQGEAVRLATATDGASAGADFGITQETAWAPGVHVAAGVALKLGPGEGVGALCWTRAPLHGVLTG